MNLKPSSKIIIAILGILLLAGIITFGITKAPVAIEMAQNLNDPIARELAKDQPYEEVVGLIEPHKALYRLHLTEIHAGSPINELTGDMFFKWEDTCEAWSTDHRFTIDYFYTDRPSISVTSHFVSWEDKKGDRIHFISEGFTDGIQDDKHRGESYRLDDHTGVVDYSEPEGLAYELKPNFFFPAQHTIATIANAIEGKKFFNAVMFDGTDDEGPSEINVFIDQKSKLETVPAALKDKENIDVSLLNNQSWDMRLAFFPLEGADGNTETPSYEMKVRLHENGVVSDIIVEYDKFSVRQELIALSRLPQTECSIGAFGDML